jgi:hypothetical protein
MLGLKEVSRPASIKFPGAWFAVPTPGGQAVIHGYAGSAAADPDGRIPDNNESGVADHLSLSAHGFLEFRENSSPWVSHGASKTTAGGLPAAPSLLADIRAKLSRNRDAFPLFDTDRFRRNIEAAYIGCGKSCRAGSE